ncbi:hypothetical protein HMPREF9240_01490 [Winkia neuii BV029A5]|uniref:Uncharacterized protein n=1 Tax=Winkia neuii BV029A5 TaxID=888439 RepID=K0YQE2_9ACTO|nr:hypothetical protein HMPREF9240_01490 [Winkia neuii BV029A5]
MLKQNEKFVKIKLEVHMRVIGQNKKLSTDFVISREKS